MFWFILGLMACTFTDEGVQVGGKKGVTIGDEGVAVGGKKGLSVGQDGLTMGGDKGVSFKDGVVSVGGDKGVSIKDGVVSLAGTNLTVQDNKLCQQEQCIELAKLRGLNKPAKQMELLNEIPALQRVKPEQKKMLIQALNFLGNLKK